MLISERYRPRVMDDSLAGRGDAVTAHRQQLGAILRDLRMSHGRTQCELADILGVSEEHLASVERGEVVVSTTLRQALREFFGSAFGGA
jgi:DNA-binding XRE family transcriptional regulator